MGGQSQNRVKVPQASPDNLPITFFSKASEIPLNVRNMYPEHVSTVDLHTKVEDVARRR